MRAFMLPFLFMNSSSKSLSSEYSEGESTTPRAEDRPALLQDPPRPQKTVGPALGFLPGAGLVSEAGVAASVGAFSEYL